MDEESEVYQGRIRARLEVLRKELETGHSELRKVRMQQEYLHETVLRIEGAVQVLEELLRDGGPGGPTAVATSEPGPTPQQAGPMAPAP